MASNLKPLSLEEKDGLFIVKLNEDEKIKSFDDYEHVSLSKTNRIFLHWWRISPGRYQYKDHTTIHLPKKATLIEKTKDTLIFKPIEDESSKDKV